MPLVAAAYGEGRLSYSKVRALTRVATPDLESELLGIALAGTASHLERIARGYRRVQRCQQTGEDSRHADRYLRWHWDDEGALVLRARLAPEEGALRWRHLLPRESAGPSRGSRRSRRETFPRERFAAVGGSPHPDRLPAERPPTEASLTRRQPSDPATEASLTRPEPQPDTPDADVSAETPAMSTADALVTMAETLLAAGPAHLVGDDRYQVVVHVDLDTLRAAPVPPLSGVTRAETEDGMPLLPETLARLACDSALLAIVEDAAGTPPST